MTTALRTEYPVATHCRRGHSMADAYVRPDGSKRKCRVCQRERERERNATRAATGERETLLAVPNAPLRERFEELVAKGEVSPTSVAARMGWSKKRTHPTGKVTIVGDGLRLLNALGRDGRKMIRYETAVALAPLLKMDFFEAGV